MDSNLDPFDDILHDSTSNCVARPGVKFQPRTKFQPSKVTAALVASELPPNATEKAITPSVSSLDINKLVQSVDTAEDGLTGSSVPASSAGTKEPSKSNYDNTTVLSAREVDSSGFNLDQLDDIFCSSATDHVVPATKFQPRAKPLPTEVTTAAVDPPTLPSNTVREADVPSRTGLDTTNIVQPIDSGDVRNTGPVGSSLASSVGLKVPLERNNENKTFGLVDEAGSSTFDLYPSDELNPNTALNLYNNIPPNLTSLEFPVEKEQTAVTEVSHLDNINIVHEEDPPGVPEKKTSKSIKKRAASDSKLPTKSKKSSIAVEMDEGGKSSRQLRKRATTTQLVDEQGNGAPAEPASSSGADEDDEDYAFTFDEDRDDDDNTVSKKKRASQKSMKPVAKKEQPVRKRKKANDTAEQSTIKPPKKFSHSTRRNKRHVNKDLLNMPEDEIDYSSLAVKDIIFLAEHKEKLAVKESKASVASSKTSLANHSNERYSSEVHSQDEEVSFNSEQGGGYAYNEENTIQAASLMYNAHSFMNRPPTLRWTKQDTEMFYEGIQNFGTDLSLIQQLFPGRTRRQMYLKLKKEQRQHPLKLAEAENNRPKDHSYFMRLIKQQQAEKEPNKNGLIDASAEDEDEDELEAETTEQVAKSELEEDAAKGSRPQDSAEIDDVNVEEEEEEDDNVWGTYRSDF